MLVHLRDDRPVALRGDPENPNNRGFLCAKGRASLELAHHPDRLLQPLERRGAVGFRPISWESAYDRIADRLSAARDAGRPESVVFAQGTDRNYQEWLFRFANAFGSPNVLGPAHVCFYPRVMAGILSMGAFTFCDYEGDPEILLVWGSNKVLTHGDGVIGTRLLGALGRGSRLLVVDPRRTPLVPKADEWLQILPGTDAALALALIHVVIADGLYDRSFVERHTSGFERLARHVEPLSPSWASQITSIPESTIRRVARLYARAGSAAIEVGTGVEQNRNSFHTLRALLILSALCGNIDRPGGDLIWEPSGIVGRRTLPRFEALPERSGRLRLGARRHPLLSMAGWAHPEAVWQAILERRPYGVDALLVFGNNALLSYAGSERVRAALDRVPFLLVADLFMTPTAHMADVVLPVSSWLERDQIVEHAHYLAARRRCLSPRGSCRSDERILNDLAHGLGLEGFWSSDRESLDQRLAPLGLDWPAFVRRGYLANPRRPFKYREQGFATPDGRFQLYGRGLERMGLAPLPLYRPAPPLSGGYLLTAAHSKYFFNSEFRNLAGLRGKEPDATLEIHPVTASREGLSEGDWVNVSTGAGSAAFRVRIHDGIAPGVVCAAAGWWSPELPTDDGWRRSNVNLLTDDRDSNEEMGSPNFRGISCRLQRLAAAPSMDG